MEHLTHLDLDDPALARCPYPTYAQLRAEAPLCRVQLPDGRSGWFVTRYEDVHRVLNDHRRFSNRWMVGQQAAMPELSPRARAVMDLFSDMMLGSDPPQHTRLREAVRTSFTPRLVESLRPYVEELADVLLDDVERRALKGDRTMDLIADYALPLPIAVILQLLGVPPEHREDMRRWADAAAFDGSAADAEQIGSEIEDFNRYAKVLLEEKRRAPQDDLLSGLVRGDDGAEPLSDEQLAAMVYLLMFAGHETTVHLIGNGMLALLTDPPQLARLQAEPSLVGTAVEELLRYDTSVAIPRPRVAVEDVEMGGVTINRGDVVLPVIASANRDEDRFEAADELDVARNDKGHLAFGRGIHTCLGAPLGRMETQIAIATLLRRMPDLTLAVAPEQLRWRRGGRRRGVVALPLRF